MNVATILNDAFNTPSGTVFAVTRGNQTFVAASGSATIEGSVGGVTWVVIGTVVPGSPIVNNTYFTKVRAVGSGKVDMVQEQVESTTIVQVGGGASYDDTAVLAAIAQNDADIATINTVSLPTVVADTSANLAAHVNNTVAHLAINDAGSSSTEVLSSEQVDIRIAAESLPVRMESGSVSFIPPTSVANVLTIPIDPLRIYDMQVSGVARSDNGGDFIVNTRRIIVNSGSLIVNVSNIITFSASFMPLVTASLAGSDLLVTYDPQGLTNMHCSVTVIITEV